MEEALIIFFGYLPLVATFVGTMCVFCIKEKSDTLWVLANLAAWTVAYYFFDTQIFQTSASPFMRFTSFSFLAFLSPFVMTCLICLLWKLNNERVLPWYYYLWYIPPIALCSISLMLYLVVDRGEAIFYVELHDRLHQFPEQFREREVFWFSYILQTKVSAVVQYVYTAWVIGYSIVTMHHTGFNWPSLVGFLFKRSSLPPMHILMIMVGLVVLTISVRVYIGLYYMLEHPWVNVIFSLLQAIGLVLLTLSSFCIGYEECTLRQLLRLDPKENLHPVADVSAADDDADDAAAPLSPDDNAAFRQVQARLDDGLRDLMDERHAFLDSELRLVDVARMLCTNRNYLSRHINERYGINFNEYLNRMRIRYSKQYMLDNPNQLLDQIAIECGFGTAQSFGRKFKAIEGVTPRTWMVSNRKR